MSQAPLDSLWLRILPQQVRSRLAGRQLLQTLIENAGWLVADKIFRLGVGLFVNVWVARYLGPSQFGSLNYVLALVGLISALATMGLPDILIRDFVRHPERAREIAATSFLLRCAGSVLSMIIVAVIVLIARPHENGLLVMAVVVGGALLPQSIDAIDQYFQAHNEVRPIVILRNAAFVVSAIGKVVAIMLGAPVIVFAALFTFELSLVAIALYLYSRRRALGFRVSNASMIEAQRMMAETWPLLLRLFAMGVCMRIDQVMLGWLLGDYAVGIYAAASRISEVWYFIPGAMMTVFVPRLAAQHVQSPQFYEEQLQKLMRAIVGLSLAVALIMSLAARPIIALLYGPAYAEAAAVLTVHAWSGVFVGIGVASSSWFVNNSLLRYGLYQAVAGAVVSVGLNFLLIPRLGVVGSAWATVGSYVVSAVLMNIFFKPTRHILRLQLRAIGFD